ncbi:carboxymuconolactone decarboxylase family protein [Marinobacter sp. F4216]|uniref:carboxymuconolactone decarboxylase family protein n=1 Tax=Marinobacter sp. F4216 TaxID=2874281 RepID=UPI001CBFF495|nr:carboxymuconolactone decarboxylase family protein [Marinobacter sp. F4216]MBZ2169036.1 carboxymuconolactone decarboxylase family protein [Marinobacter sp. F4216]
MALLPETTRLRLFDKLSIQTMRYVHAVPYDKATGALKEMYEQVNRDFFINGSLTARSKVTNLFAAAWVIGREAILVTDELDRTTKEAIAAVLSSINDCPYCGEMLISLVHAGKRSDDAMKIFDQDEETIEDPQLKARLAWVKAVVRADDMVPPLPFSTQQLPEVIASIMAMSDINRFSHVVMAGSPVKVPFGAKALRKAALKVFGNELKPNHHKPLSKGTSLHFLPAATMPPDLNWANGNPRVAQAVARWAAMSEEEATALISPEVKQRVHANLRAWDGKPMPMGRHWAEREIEGLAGKDKRIARFALLLAKAPWTIDDNMVTDILAIAGNEKNFIRILAWSSCASARHLAGRIARSIPEINQLPHVA